MKKWKNAKECFKYYVDKEFFGTHYIVIFWHRFYLPDVRIKEA